MRQLLAVVIVLFSVSAIAAEGETVKKSRSKLDTKKEDKLLKRLDKFQNKFCTQADESNAANCAQLRGEIAHTKDIVQHFKEGAAERADIAAKVKSMRKLAKEIRKNHKLAKNNRIGAKQKRVARNQEIKKMQSDVSSENFIKAHGTRTEVVKRDPSSVDDGARIQLKVDWDVNRIRPAFPAQQSSSGVN
jgi:hypothetical protein